MNVAPDTWKDLPVTLVGMGRSAVGAAKLLQHHGAAPFVTELSDVEALIPWRAELEASGIPFEVGGHTARAWATPSLVVMSPGVPVSIAPVVSLRERDVEVIGELELAFRFATAPILAVTGTNGKTTVTELLKHLIQACGHSVLLAGNNHTSFSAAVLDSVTPDYYVLEVSSYQLESVCTFRPWIGAILNVTPDHLGRHGTMENYGASKARIFGNDGASAQVAVLNADDSRVWSMETPRDTSRVGFSITSPVKNGLYSDGHDLWVDGDPVGELPGALPGAHNRSNMLAALSMMHAGGFDLACCVKALPDFPGVEHRLEAVGDYGDRTWINDSKSTNVDSLRVALESFDVPVTLIAGGQGKGSSYEALVPLVAHHVSHLVAYGAEGPVLVAAFKDVVATTVVPDMEAAVQSAHVVSDDGGTILLSPGCASFDLYTNFEARGAHFKALVVAEAYQEIAP
tara:strand:- start:375 stop:1745 length:1371 start_codon:yes stop_codon:yes gene_type:complete